MARSIAFYSDVMGLELVRGSAKLAFFRSGKDHVVLAQTDMAAPGEPPKTSANAHHAFIVESRDFDESLKFLAAKNVQVYYQDERDDKDTVFAGRSAYFRDPDGNLLEIIDLAAMAYRPK